MRNSDAAAAHARRVAIGGWLVSGAIFTCGAAYWLGVQSARPQPPVETAVPPPTAAPAQTAPQPPMTGAVRQQRAVTAGEPARFSAFKPREPANRAKAIARASRQPVQAAKEVPVLQKDSPARVAVAAKGKSPVFPVAGPKPVATSQPLPSMDGDSRGDGGSARLAAFSDVGDARRVWREMERYYPRLRTYRAGIIQNRDWNGRVFYQFQVATASALDSRMLCARMQALDYRCEPAGR